MMFEHEQLQGHDPLDRKAYAEHMVDYKHAKTMFHHYAYNTNFAPVMDVASFMHAVGHYKPQGVIAKPDLKHMGLYARLLQEEFKETEEAWIAFLLDPTEEHLAKWLDGLFDTIWVAFGAMLASGVPINAIWREGADSNLSKLGPDDKATFREDGKLMKPAYWKAPNFLFVVKTHLHNIPEAMHFEPTVLQKSYAAYRKID